MSNIKKLMMSAAGGGGPDVDEVFSTYLWVGNATARNIVNGIDLSTEGGLVWTKNRDTNGMSHALVDTERGANKLLSTNTSGVELNSSGAYGVNGFNTDGFSLPSGEGAYYENRSGRDAASWSFRKAPKFFDVVTYSGTGSAQNISHSLGSNVGMLAVKCLNDGENWRVWHRNLSSGDTYLAFNSASAQTTDSFNRIWNGTNPTSSVFTVGTDNSTNGSGKTYVAYLWAHNDGDGEFGPTGDQDIIKCGGHASGGQTDEEIDLGFEAQFVLIKASTAPYSWEMYDTMRGMNHSTNTATQGAYLYPNTNTSEVTHDYRVGAWEKGFKFSGGGNNTSYIYMAIRRGPLAVPEDATKVFDVKARAGTGSTAIVSSSLTYVDAALLSARTGNTYKLLFDRLRGKTKFLLPNLSIAEIADTNTLTGFDLQDGIEIGSDAGGYGINVSGRNAIDFMWKRAPGFFDLVAYSGNSTSGRTVDHNLGVVPEMFWVKSHVGTYAGSSDFKVYHKDVGNTASLSLQGDYIPQTSAGWWNNTTPTDTAFTLGNGYQVNQSGAKHIAYLFASLPGISKVGSYTGNGSSQTINCGFTSGARFILVKRTDSTGDWYVWDTERGIVAGNDPYLELNTFDAEVTSTDWVDPDNSGFIVNGTTINASSASYIFYAIA